MTRADIGLKLFDDQWEKNGWGDDSTTHPDASLLHYNGGISINGCMMHVEALRVCEDESTGQQIFCSPGHSEEDRVLERLQEYADGPVSTVTIWGSEYVLLVTPYQM